MSASKDPNESMITYCPIAILVTLVAILLFLIDFHSDQDYKFKIVTIDPVMNITRFYYSNEIVKYPSKDFEGCVFYQGESPTVIGDPSYSVPEGRYERCVSIEQGDYKVPLFRNTIISGKSP